MKKDENVKTVTKALLVARLQRRLGAGEISLEEAREFVDNFTKEISDTLAEGKEVKISRLGTFMLTRKSQRVGRNPRKKEKDVIIKARTVVRFVSSKVIKRKILNKK